MDEETQRRIEAILAAFDGRETEIAAAGRENVKTVNRLGRLCALKRVGGESTFKRNLTRYQVAGAERELLIGAERAGGGVWRLVARWAEDQT